MAKKNKKEVQIADIGETLSKTEQYIEDNQNSLILIIIVIVGIFLLFSGYQKLYIQPLEEEARIEIYMAELYFQKDSFNLALNGDGQYAGFLDIANDYSSTKVGKLANYYAGICYLRTNEYKKAIEYLKEFSSKDIILTSLAKGCIGDAYVELNKFDSAIDAYKKAINNSENEFTAPRYMMKLAHIYEKNGKKEKALELYNNIKNNFKETREAANIDKYISRIEVK